ncbi:Vms1/Ankzf1 family peptidyl-tRNA hydrolase [Cryptosporangium japonicum]|uniref:Vms1/Ankzf1 family peptidyl-tRNA hydrolase n=1 Tax=Cryptosporangium japonicum TaxID=80872 RepID=A0ABN0U5F1_9ACTN
MELEFLSELAVRRGPFATVYLDASHNTPDAERRVDLSWRDARRDLASQGADEATLTALDKAVETAEPAVGPAGRVLVAAHGETLLDRSLPGPPLRIEARWSPLPHVMPLLAQYPDPLPYLVVVADRSGADVSAWAGPGEQLFADSVVGPDQYPLHKVPGGGWSALRYQHAVEVAWEHNAVAVAQEVTRVADAVRARLVVVAGDVRARSLLMDSLPPRVAEVAVSTESGSRADPSGLDVDSLVSARISSERSELLERLGAGYARDTAVQGLEAVVGALREGMVDTLVVVDDPSSDLTLAVGPDPLQLALREDVLAGYGVEARRDRADAAIVRALAASGGRLEVITYDRSPDEDLNESAEKPPVEFTDGLAAIVRRPGAGQY